MKKTIITIIATLFLASMLSMAFVTPAKAQYVVDDYTVGLWHFNKEFGTALEFDGGDDYVSMGLLSGLSALDFGTGESFTIELWLKTTQDPAGPTELVGIYSSLTYPTPNQFYMVSLAPGGLAKGYLRVNDGAASAWVLSTSAVNDGSWHHIAFVKDVAGGALRIYVDGSLEDTSSFTDGETFNDCEFHLGNGHWNRYFMGVMDNVRISNDVRSTFDLCKPLASDDHTVGLWHFDEGTGTTASDSSEYGNDGTLCNFVSPCGWVDSTLAIDSSPYHNFGTIHGATWVDDGMFGKALYFDGTDDYVEVPDSPSLDITDEITIEAWTKRMDSKYQTIVAKWRIGDLQRSYLLALTADNKVRFWLSPDGTWANRKELTSTTTVGTDWTHIMATWDGTTMKIFINGVEDPTTQTAEISNYEGNAKLTVGKYEDYTIHPPRYFKGIIEEIRISNVARVPVNIDIKPGSDPNSICLKDSGLLPLAILSTDAFDATQIDPESLLLGGVGVSSRGSRKAPKIAYSIEDVDGDGYPDMMAFFSVPDLASAGLTLTTTILELTAILTDGTHITGIDSVRIVPP